MEGRIIILGGRETWGTGMLEGTAQFQNHGHLVANGHIHEK